MALAAEQGKHRPMFKKILIVDDSELIRDRLVSFLKCIPGVEVIDTAATLAHALERVRQQPPELVILDLHLPDGLGWDIVHLMKSLVPGLQIAVLTTHANRGYRQQSLSLGANWFFDKATEFDSLLKVIEQQAAH